MVDSQPPRACGECGLCCKVLRIDMLDKPRDHGCTNFQPGRGCLAYDTRPATCRNFTCQWLIDDSLDQHWKPSECNFIIRNAQSGIQILSDPDFPDSWRREPYWSAIKEWRHPENAIIDR